jgi:SRSO17 transposase
VIGHADRAGPLRDYCQGLSMPCERTSIEPIAAMRAPEQTAAQHQSLLHFVGQSPWPDERVLAKAGKMVLPAIESHGPIEAWVIDAKLSAHGARSKHFKIHELEPRPNDLSSTQEIQAGGFMAPRNCRAGAVRAI